MEEGGCRLWKCLRYAAASVRNGRLSLLVCASVVLNAMRVPPLMVRLKNEQHPLSADTSYEIVCEVIGARPKPNVTWWLDAKQLHTAKEPVLVDDNSTISTLKFIPKLGDTGKTLACRAGSLEHLWTLNIYQLSSTARQQCPIAS
ncbi:unnamed protein product [Bemisia tabaci]|uniref:Ig-like domain-containing protein n=1 Tax=Bemisia tabaci TaxID=7038 RepID=A0A9P0A6H7_BEMTA|nr:unnamed protein product [Bemisia tabaci]